MPGNKDLDKLATESTERTKGFSPCLQCPLWFITCNSQLATRNSQFAIRNSQFVIRHSPIRHFYPDLLQGTCQVASRGEKSD